jgi:hypothetical protein
MIEHTNAEAHTCHSLYIIEILDFGDHSLAQNLARAPNEDVALHGAGFMVRFPPPRAELFREPGQPASRIRSGYQRPANPKVLKHG